MTMEKQAFKSFDVLYLLIKNMADFPASHLSFRKGAFKDNISGRAGFDLTKSHQLVARLQTGLFMEYLERWVGWQVGQNFR